MDFFDKMFAGAESYTVNIGTMEFELTREAIIIGDFPIYWYGVLIALGFMVALIYGFRRAADFGIKTDPLIDVILVGAVASIIGARLYYVLNDDAPLSEWSFAEIVDIRDGGLGFYGALIFAVIFGGIMCKIRKINVFSALDLAGPAFLIAQAIGRWGNFVNQEAFGTNTNLPFGMYSEKTRDYLMSVMEKNPDANLDPFAPVHPCFLYESIWCLLGFSVVHFLSKLRVFRGETFLYYIVWYGFGRFFIEGLRTDSLYLFNTPIRISQLVAALCVVIGIVLIIFFRKKYKNNPQIEAAEGTVAEKAVPEAQSETDLQDPDYTSIIIDDNDPVSWTDDKNADNQNDEGEV